ncbi:uncharacterized protein [Palaemon carinicauda]|uniref:uncharacterized protein n=1 Tax=Palaemon carinicauda TaxID=392227 RepID=UPI0035B5FFA6
MVLERLLKCFKTFSTVITQEETTVSFSEFKKALRSFEETERSHQVHLGLSKSKDGVMKSSSRPSSSKLFSSGNIFTSTCFSCGKFIDNGDSTKSNSQTIQAWHRVMSHCNARDLPKLPGIVDATQKFLADISPYGSVKRLRTDNGTEFTNKDFRSLLIRNCIKYEFSASVFNFRHGQMFIIRGKIAEEFWTYAVKTSAYIRNRCLNPRTEERNMSEYIFDDEFPLYTLSPKVLDPLEVEHLVTDDEKKHNQGQVDESDKLNKEKCKGDFNRKYPKRERRKQVYLNGYDTDTDSSSIVKCSVDYCYRVTDIPRTYDEAVSSPDATHWREAMKEEVKSPGESDTYELVPLPGGRSQVAGRWVYTVKLGPNNDEKYKARFVAKGYSQIQNIDCQETFPPTAHITSVCMFMQFAIQ